MSHGRGPQTRSESLQQTSLGLGFSNPCVWRGLVFYFSCVIEKNTLSLYFWNDVFSFIHVMEKYTF